MECPLVTALIITHNRYDLVMKAIVSVQNQTYPNMELILVDDASDSKIRESLEAQSIEENYTYIYIEKGESKGGAHARNVGILNSRGKYIAFLDDDDEWMPEKIEKQIQMLNCYPESQICYCGKIRDFNFGELQIPDDPVTFLGGDLSREIFIKWQCVSSQMVVEKKLLLTVGMFDEALLFWQDYELCMRLFQNTKVSVVRENLVLYRVIRSDQSRLSNKMDGWENAVKYIYKKHSEEIASLSKKDIEQRNLYMYNDALNRCISSGDKKKQRKYLWKIFLIKKNPKSFLRMIFNVVRLKEMPFIKSLYRTYKDYNRD